MFDRIRHATRDRIIRAVQDATRPDLSSLETRLDALAGDLRRIEERLDATDKGIRDHLTGWERRQRRDILTATDWKAMSTSADFFHAELGAATAHFDKFDTLRAALGKVTLDGLHLEFGVASGSTLRVIAEHATTGPVFGFDSFNGLPEHWRSGFGVGAFATEQLPDVPGAELVVGLFDQTLPGFLTEHPEPVAFLHLDADLYSSTKTVLAELAPRLQAGTVIVFDEYFNFPEWEQHEHKAWTEFVAETQLTFEYLGFTADDEQLSVRLLSAPVLEQEPEQAPRQTFDLQQRNRSLVSARA